MEHAIDEARGLLQALVRASETESSRSADRERLAELTAMIETLAETVQADLDRELRVLAGSHSADVIVERHEAMVSHFDRSVADVLRALRQALDPSSTSQSLDTAGSTSLSCWH